MAAVVFIDGGYIDVVNRGTAGWDAVRLDYGKLGRLLGEMADDSDVRRILYYNAEPPKPPSLAPREVRTFYARDRDHRMRFFDALENRADIEVRMGFVQLQQCDGFTILPGGGFTYVECGRWIYRQKKVDTVLVSEAVELVYTAPELDTFIFLAADCDLIPAADIAATRGKSVAVCHAAGPWQTKVSSEYAIGDGAGTWRQIWLERSDFVACEYTPPNAKSGMTQKNREALPPGPPESS